MDYNLVRVVVDKIVKIKKVAVDLELLPIWCENHEIKDVPKLSIQAPSSKVFFINDLNELNAELDSYLKVIEPIVKETEKYNISHGDMGIFFNEIENYEATDFALSFSYCVAGREESDHVISIYDLGDMVIYAPKDIEEAKKLASILAPATLYSECFEKKEFVSKEIMCY